MNISGFKCVRVFYNFFILIRKNIINSKNLKLSKLSSFSN